MQELQAPCVALGQEGGGARVEMSWHLWMGGKSRFGGASVRMPMRGGRPGWDARNWEVFLYYPTITFRKDHEYLPHLYTNTFSAEHRYHLISLTYTYVERSKLFSKVKHWTLGWAVYYGCTAIPPFPTLSWGEERKKVNIRKALEQRRGWHMYCAVVVRRRKKLSFRFQGSREDNSTY